MSATPGSATVSDASYAQERLHFLDRLANRGEVYTVARQLDLTGRLDPAALVAAVRLCVRRHESLRTCFRLIDGRLRQIVTDRELTPRVIDLRHVLPAGDSRARERVVAELIRQEAAEPFDLRRFPLLRATLIMIAEDRGVLLVTLHHIIVDAWSLDLFLRDVFALYEASVTGAPHGLPELTLQYPDYAAWQRRVDQDGGNERHRAYWSERIRDLRELDLPTDRPLPETRTNEGGSHRFPLDDSLVKSLLALCRQEQVSPFMALLSGYILLLHRYTGRNDITVGGTTSGRGRPEVQDMIGFFVNMLVFRTTVDAPCTLRELLRRTADMCHSAYDHQEMPFEQIVALRAGAREANRHPIFQSVFQMIHESADDLSIPGLEVRTRDAQRPISTFDLLLTVGDSHGRMSVNLEYATDIWDRDTIVRLGADWVTILRWLVRDPERRVGEFPLADSARYTPDALSAELRAAPALAHLSPEAVPAVRDRYGHPAPRGAIGELHLPDETHTATGLMVRATADGRLLLVTTRPDGGPTSAPPPHRQDTDPDGHIERDLADMWQKLLRVGTVGRHDNFFAAGGHSLLATVLITQAQERFGVETTLEDFFRTPTVAGLAARISDGLSDTAEDRSADA